ncbi:MAG TPA: hypothetical protein VNW53_15320 [Phenylobacterium sp.]|jgi:hypothetical protein|uniref:DUF7662 domain-containing protein n=1 Tax=Phenylobacterium sp. TaxID=1871053 RepID=UPI002D0AB34B|nr:hypothetical protein [Phenylobacterium sp.]HXA40367.1 hypothetical protein [Phenylobacterium sp.]
MSKYDPLKDFLKSRPGTETPMSFPEVEEVLGFELPPSARQYPAWWSNNVGTHVGARAWREAGWKTSRVDVGGERVTFVREESRPFTVDAAPGASTGDAILLSISRLSISALRMIDDWAEEAGLDRSGAIVAILEASAAGRRRRMLETLSVGDMPAGHDSTAMIRQDRDER